MLRLNLLNKLEEITLFPFLTVKISNRVIWYLKSLIWAQIRHSRAVRRSHCEIKFVSRLQPPIYSAKGKDTFFGFRSFQGWHFEFLNL
jgi:hypothetical protein